MIYVVWVLALEVTILGYLVFVYHKHIKRLEAQIRDLNMRLANQFLRMHWTINRSRVAVDGRLIVPKKVLAKFMAWGQEADNAD